MPHPRTCPRFWALVSSLRLRHVSIHRDRGDQGRHPFTGIQRVGIGILKYRRLWNPFAVNGPPRRSQQEVVLVKVLR